MKNVYKMLYIMGNNVKSETESDLGSSGDTFQSQKELFCKWRNGFSELWNPNMTFATSFIPFVPIILLFLNSYSIDLTNNFKN